MKKASKKNMNPKKKRKRKISTSQLYEQLRKTLEKRIGNKDIEKDKNSKTEFIYSLIKIWIKKENRELFLKWIEMKEEIITEYNFNLWVTKNILDPDEREEE